MSFFVDVILPLPIKNTFTYEITTAESKVIRPGMRIIVPFGKRKKYTAIAAHIHQSPPLIYVPKQIESIVDKIPVVLKIQLRFIEWIASYYQAPLGLVIRTAIPSLMLLESETEVVVNSRNKITNYLSKKANLLIHELIPKKTYSVFDIQNLTSLKNPYPILKELVDNGYVSLKESIYAKYSPKKQKEISLHPNLNDQDSFKLALDSISNKPKQYRTFLVFLQENQTVLKSDFIKFKGVSPSSLKTLIKNDLLFVKERTIDRLSTKDSDDQMLPELSNLQEEAKKAIKFEWNNKNIVLLHGVTGSGKTEVYMHLISQQLVLGKSVLFLVPEIGLTSQLMERLYCFFGKHLVVYHSRYSPQERAETWDKILKNKIDARLVLGTRSAVFLPFNDLGLVVIDESHETSYKQYEATPRYHARDSALVLASMHKSKVVMGTATPSIDSYFHACIGKYGLVNMAQRFKNAQLPKIEFVDLSEAYRKKQMNGHLSRLLIDYIKNTLIKSKQILLFQNRRGYSSFIECQQCGHVPHCPSCDVSLTFHQVNNELRCHYCGYKESYISACKACGTLAPQSQGLGTQQLEEEIKNLFPKARVSRMDLDTTRKKYAHQKIITAFSNHDLDILIGTQMITKGLDFKKVALVGVLSADNFLHFPDFRSHERAFQVLTQVSGRAGRSGEKSKVLVQTFQPNHPILSYVRNYDYLSFYNHQIKQREQFGYPPFKRMLRVELKHKNMTTLINAGEWLKKGLKERFSSVYGPAPPIVGRIRNFYLLQILIKMPMDISHSAAKKRLSFLLISFSNVVAFNQVKVVIDVDPQ